MKYTYAYKTSEGTRREDAIEAPSRDAAFQTLRARGIRPIKVVAADGSKANGELRGVRKRVFFASLVVAVAVASVVAYRRGSEVASREVAQDRHQVYGDPAIIQDIESGALSVARGEVERFLFAYAIPGREVGAIAAPKAAERGDFELIELSPGDGREVREYKQILNGMKLEARQYLAGGGTWQGFVSELKARQAQECDIYERTRQELETFARTNPDPAALDNMREKSNAALRAIGLRTIPKPKPGE